MKSWILKFLQFFSSQPNRALPVKEEAIKSPVSNSMERIDYSDGGWSETHYVFDKQNGLQTFYYSNGQKKWERSFEKGVQVGIEQFWDERSTLIKEGSYSFGVLHGEQKERLNEQDSWKQSIFKFGMPIGFLEQVVNPEFIRLIKPHFIEAPIANRKQATDTLQNMVLNTCAFVKGNAIKSLPTKAKSMWGHVNIIGEDETWPTKNGSPLAPILQIKCSDIPSFDHHLGKFSWVTLFADKEKEFTTIDEMFLLRTYKKMQKLSRLIRHSQRVL